jgi:hypothetical protein
MSHHLPPCAILLALALAGCQEAHADTRADTRPGPRPGYPPGAPSASASGSGAGAPTAEPDPEPEPKSADGRKPWVPVFDAPFPEGSSPAPTVAEWASAPIAVEVRITEPGCEVRRVREWYRVSNKFMHGAELVSGGREDVSFGCRRDDKDSVFCSEAWVIFPARRGDRRALDLFGFFKWGPEPDAILTEQFLEGDPAPLVSVHGLRWEF